MKITFRYLNLRACSYPIPEHQTRLASTVWHGARETPILLLKYKPTRNIIKYLHLI